MGSLSFFTFLFNQQAEHETSIIIIKQDKFTHYQSNFPPKFLWFKTFRIFAGESVKQTKCLTPKT